MKKSIVFLFFIGIMLCYAQGYEIGDKGPCGGTVFFIHAGKCYEYSEPIGRGTWDDALKLCENYRGGGYSNWYLPSKSELSLIYWHIRSEKGVAGTDIFWSYSGCMSFVDGEERDGYHGYKRAVLAVRRF